MQASPTSPATIPTTIPTATQPTGELPWLVQRVTTSEEKLALIHELAVQGASHPEIRDVAFRLTWPVRHTPLFQAQRIHAWVRCVRFIPERVETFQKAYYTQRVMAGDCDDQTILQTALALAVELPIRLVPWQPMKHICSAYEFGSALVWSETTIAAWFGEDPLKALARLGTRTRRDIG